MSWMERIAGRDVGVLGLGRSGMATVRALLGKAGRVMAFDDDARAIARAVELGAVRPDPAAIGGLAAMVVSPGIPLTHPAPHPVVQAASQANIPLIADLDLLAARLGDRLVVGITGTNGKSTTAALIHHLLTRAGRPAVLGGNIGVPVLDLDLGPPDAVVVLELSSYQLDLIHDLPIDVSVWTNLTPDHLDRHGSMDGYIQAKEKLFRHGRGHATAVIGADDRPSRLAAIRLAALGTHRIVPVSGDHMPGPGVGVVEGRLIDASDKTSRFVTDLGQARTLRGHHNQQNAAAAYAAVRALGMAPKVAAEGMFDFPGLPHRMEQVLEKDGVAWVNDSKATNPDAAGKSLAAYERIVWIAGGRPKPGGFRELAPAMANVTTALLIGEAADAIAADLGSVVECRKVGTLEAAVAAAREIAGPGATVLLAPACASFDQFQDYEARGQAFRALAAGRAA
ncbi:UDP-N-acetylmuramoyl-L-alanine--D-glutamate ligase [Geminicoccus roseus]|uniref:UDP-N-acetylmuramoyl-L-alanine--D-glutamate ligase n=1 Tax=Geminicoccus roseus TaxID=404900 RepID=UPI000488BFAE|nr:UDP-N-acetylmuramoyl-L-alanine--D-glutamate ligase [Geminicoccus roseus]